MKRNDLIPPLFPSSSSSYSDSENTSAAEDDDAHSRQHKHHSKARTQQRSMQQTSAETTGTTVVKNRFQGLDELKSGGKCVVKDGGASECTSREPSAAAAAAAASASAGGGGSSAAGVVSVSIGPAPKNNHVKPRRQRYDVLLVLDFEATCDRDILDYPHEIIEFPVVALSTSTRRVMGEFHSFVKPRIRPHLTEFCTELTGITQDQVDAAPPLPEVLNQFAKWMQGLLPDPENTVCVFATDGPWDLRKFMFTHSMARDGIAFPSIFFSFVNVRNEFATFFRCKPMCLGRCLGRLGLQFEGRQHSGMDDTRNIARVVKVLLDRGHRFGAAYRIGGTREEAEQLDKAIAHVTTGKPPVNGLEKALYDCIEKEGPSVLKELQKR